MKEKVPRHIAEQYDGGARGFRTAKRRQLRALVKALEELRLGCAYFPDNGIRAVEAIAKQAKDLRRSLSIESWGR